MEEIINLYTSRPRRVHSSGNTHYFYWRWGGYKPLDYEPIMVIHKKRLVISRIHWKLATIWFSSKYSKNKPNAAFVYISKMFDTHTPIVESNNYQHFLVRKEKDLVRTLEIDAAYSAFGTMLEKAHGFFGDSPVSYIDVITDDPVPEKYIFDLKKIKSMVIIGRFRPSRLPQELRGLMNY